MKLTFGTAALIATLLLTLSSRTSPAQPAPSRPAAEKIIIDTDIGDDIDDAFAVALALSSPEVKIVGITSAWGDTDLRSRLLDRILCETGRADIPVYTGVPTKTMTKFTQKPWAEAGREHPHTDAVTFLLDEIRHNPGEITLVAIAPLTNIGAAIDRDPATFRKLKRVVMMGGSIHRGYDDFGYTTIHNPEPEYNIYSDVPAAKKLFSSGVPIYMMPLDSTQQKFDEVKRSLLASISTPLTDSLQLLTAEWQRSTGQTTPTLYDPVAMAYAIDPATCPTTPLHIEVDDKGFTRVTPGAANANACLKPHTDAFFNLLMPRLLNQKLSGTQTCTASEAK
ncbi:inosine-uridine preferring nucleoside hydrolase [Edaphobacter acidisoli]|uniref:Inosine-uridine preferring nucleoside hydrolase n=1 Tax=Edaphobacter acidisoli TaxID=2040573 RepID=A0A916RVG6_9BACT|nr:nucleoside hydrolase [Edaphobacter acidisoli]GGA71216.1 inosine-uridine preferring nucleoside hydrolase [Edaphobacter acidisoli]